MLAHMLSVLPFVHVPQDKVAAISRQVSLALVGIIILSSIRRVLRGVAGVRLVSLLRPREGMLTSSRLVAGVACRCCA